MTDPRLMEADCVHGIPWYECKKCPPGDELVPEMTIVIHLPQPMDKMVRLMLVLGELWPKTPIEGLGHIEIGAE